MPKLPDPDPSWTDVTQSVGLPQSPQVPVSPKKLKLPPGLASPDVTYRHEVSPAMALSLLREIQSQVIELQQTLRSLVGQIQQLYAEGPIVEGWLESAKAPLEPGTAHQERTESANRALLRHADVDDLMAYVQALEESASMETAETTETTETPETAKGLPPTPVYRLCRLDESGQVLSRPCPTEQVATVSMAIARHQKLTQLVEQRLRIEDKLKGLVNVLSRAKQALADS